ncbi:hypothetical protein LTV02_11710 [Nocardia yamanashiensis]|uniref:hypothetical protein n=1 Tax=Nocardia yamanashiensis TaxID=209247 RepID=UPI001E3EAE22|nr:hypothetical protein [Nocardia yamanashiensis]UGT44001.1 hypothetical protein LTV02_11710 [Nocardia yamanashiensis]
MRKIAATSALLIGTAVVGCGTATAAPAPAAAEPVNYAAQISEKNAVITTDAGSLTAENGVFAIKAADGTVLGGTELSFRVDDFVFPIAAEINNHTATLTPQFDLAHATYKPVALPYENQAPWKSEYEREQAAWNRMTQTITMGATIGTLVGGIGGAGLGCLLGAGVAFAATIPLAAIFGLGPLGGCVIGASLTGFLGTVAGQLFVTAPVVIAAAVQYFTTINAPAPSAAK